MPFLHKVAPKEVIAGYLPDMTIHYNGATIVARQDPYRFVEFLFRKGSHLGVYMVLAAAAAYAFMAIPALRVKGWAVPSAVVGFTLLVSILDERLQSASGMRTPAIQDVIIDLVGATGGLLIATGTKRWWVNRKGRRENKEQPRGKEG
ncbi:hypothetical protein KCTCHS21_15010 [Cohnella abietis]|uniref:VanZ-like domain-containing protein n=1 Tax=Cohnella abietis TaxID=2507935 RepID=A0A3T1D1W0_9BACL|nr:hypothetical protein KCTCHS21_15010 [Cohnella abietis]